MKRGEATRARMIEATAELLQSQGYHATGLSQIIARARAPRGSLYFHFPGGKEELACAALRASAASWQEALGRVIDGAPDPPGTALAAARFLAETLERSDFEAGCPLATVALESAGSSEAVRAACADSYEAWVELIAARLRAAGWPSEAAHDAALFTLSALEGALLLARVHRDVAPLLSAGQKLAAFYRDR